MRKECLFLEEIIKKGYNIHLDILFGKTLMKFNTSSLSSYQEILREYIETT